MSDVFSDTFSDVFGSAGTGAPVTAHRYQLAASWSRGGDYTGTLEDVTSYVLDEPEIVASWGRTEPRATEDAAAGSMSFALRNDGRQFSPENTSSPIAGHVLPGTPVRFQVTNPADGTVTTVFKGPIDTFEVDPGAPARDFTATCSDGWGTPGDTKLSTAVFRGQRTGDLITVILDAIGWPGNPGDRSIDAGATVVPYWWVDGVDAQTAILDLVHSEGPPACAWVQNGTFCFRDRHHRVTLPQSLTSQGTYTHTIPAGAVPGDFKILRDSFSYDYGMDHIVNTATLEVTPLVPDVQQVVWSTDSPVSLAANESTTLVIRTDDPFLDLQTPSAAVTYLDDGNVLTSDYHIAGPGSVSFAVSRTSGQSALLTLTAGVNGCYLDQGLKVRATPLKTGAARLFTASDPVSQGRYGNADWGGSAPWAYFYDAQAIADRVVTIYSQPRPSVTFEVDGAISDATLSRVLNTQLSDRITVRNDELGLNGDFFVEKLTHAVKKLGVRHRLTIGAQVVEPYQAANVFTFDVAGRGFNDGQFGLSAANNPATMFRFDTAGHGFDQGVFAV